MPWAKLDDRFHDNPKVRRAWADSPDAVALYVFALTYSAAHLLDGLVLPGWVRGELPAKARREKAIRALVEAGLWVARGDGWEIKDYLVFNPSKADVEAKRDAKRAAGRAGGLASGQARRSEAHA